MSALRTGGLIGPVCFDCDYVDGQWLCKDVDFVACASPEALIGCGGIGAVYLVTFQGAPAAAKTFNAFDEEIGLDFLVSDPSSPTTSATNIRRLEAVAMELEHEVKVLTSISHHSSLCSYLGVGYGEIAGVTVPMWIVMELAEENFHTFLHGDGCGDLMPVEALRRWVQILMGIDVLHAVGICHRNIKPCNILVRGGSGSFMLADHGLARVRTSLSILTGFWQDSEDDPYAAQDGASSGKKADMYAATILLAEMLTGELPPASCELRLQWVEKASELLPKPVSNIVMLAASNDAHLIPLVSEVILAVFDSLTIAAAPINTPSLLEIYTINTPTRNATTQNVTTPKSVDRGALVLNLMQEEPQLDVVAERQAAELPRQCGISFASDGSRNLRPGISFASDSIPEENMPSLGSFLFQDAERQVSEVNREAELRQQLVSPRTFSLSPRTDSRRSLQMQQEAAEAIADLQGERELKLGLQEAAENLSKQCELHERSAAASQFELQELAANLAKQCELHEAAECRLMTYESEADVDRASDTEALQEVSNAISVQLAFAEEGERHVAEAEAELAAQFALVARAKAEQGGDQHLQWEPLLGQECIVAELRDERRRAYVQLQDQASLVEKLEASSAQKVRQAERHATELREEGREQQAELLHRTSLVVEELRAASSEDKHLQSLVAELQEVSHNQQMELLDQAGLVEELEEVELSNAEKDERLLQQERLIEDLKRSCQEQQSEVAQLTMRIEERPRPSQPWLRQPDAPKDSKESAPELMQVLQQRRDRLTRLGSSEQVFLSTATNSAQGASGPQLSPVKEETKDRLSL